MEPAGHRPSGARSAPGACRQAPDARATVARGDPADRAAARASGPVARADPAIPRLSPDSHVGNRRGHPQRPDLRHRPGQDAPRTDAVGPAHPRQCRWLDAQGRRGGGTRQVGGGGRVVPAGRDGGTWVLRDIAGDHGHDQPVARHARPAVARWVGECGGWRLRRPARQRPVGAQRPAVVLRWADSRATGAGRGGAARRPLPGRGADEFTVRRRGAPDRTGRLDRRIGGAAPVRGLQRCGQRPTQYRAHRDRRCLARDGRSRRGRRCH